MAGRVSRVWRPGLSVIQRWTLHRLSEHDERWDPCRLTIESAERQADQETLPAIASRAQTHSA